MRTIVLILNGHEKDAVISFWPIRFFMIILHINTSKAIQLTLLFNFWIVDTVVEDSVVEFGHC
jgi:hypothetical protein